MKYPWRAGGFFLARAARARARGTRAHVRNVPSFVLPKSTVRNLESSCTGCMLMSERYVLVTFVDSDVFAAKVCSLLP